VTNVTVLSKKTSDGEIMSGVMLSNDAGKAIVLRQNWDQTHGQGNCMDSDDNPEIEGLVGAA